VLTKAIIQSIDYTKNMCRVRIPLFENASRNVNMIEADAQITIVPGIYNSYKTGDIVFIGFEENKMEAPVILGKLFVSASAEAGSYRGNVSGNSLAITDSAQLPHSTLFNFDKISQNSTLYKDLNTPKKLADSILNLQLAQVHKYQTIIKIRIDETTYYLLYLKTSNDFTYTQGKSDEPLYRLCAALKNSQAENSVIPLDLAEKRTRVMVDQEATNGSGEIIYTPLTASLQIQKFTSTDLKLTVFIGGVDTYEIDKTNILSIQSNVIYY
jgi:hypothetical protein